MKSWRKTHPLPWLVACFLLGILAADQLSFPLLPVLILSFLLCILLLKRLTPVVALLFLFLLGVAWASFRFLPADGGDRGLVSVDRERDSFELVITGPVQFVREGLRVSADLLEADASGQERLRTPTRLIVYQGVPQLCSGDIVRVWGRIMPVTGFRNPGTSDRVRQSQREGIDRVVQVESAEAVVVTGRLRGVWPLRSVEELRYQLREFLISPDRSPVGARFPRPSTDASSGGETPPLQSDSGLIRALILGDRSGLSDEVTEAFRQAGLAHLLAISGQHVGLVALIFFFVFRGLLSLFPRLGLWVPLQKIAWVLAVIPAASYVGLAGRPVSAVRALIFVTVFMAAFIINRSRNLWTTLATAALIILLWDPAALFSASFQLSFAAVGALILFVRKMGKGFLPRILSLLRASVVVTIGLAPMLAYYFQQVPLAGLIANLLAVPLLGFVVLPLSLLTIVLHLIWAPAGMWLLPLAQLSTELLAQLAAWFASLDLSIPLSLRPIQVMLCYGGLLVWLGFRSVFWKRCVVTALSLLFLLGTEQFYSDFSAQATLRMTLLDVGQGDAIVLSLPGGAHYLVDGGGFYIPRDHREYQTTDIGERVITPYLRRHGIATLEGLVLTHPHPDHYEGFLTVAREIPIRNFYWNGDRFPDSSFQDLLQILQDKQVRFVQVDASTPPITKDAVQIRWLHPPREAAGELNDRSLVMRVDYGSTCFLLTGDIETEAEWHLVREGLQPCDVLKVPHHGSDTSSTEGFISAVDPQYALISVGASNPFGHPSPTVIERYQKRKIPVWRTDQSGAITVLSDGSTIQVESVVP